MLDSRQVANGQHGAERFHVAPVVEERCLGKDEALQIRPPRGAAHPHRFVEHRLDQQLGDVRKVDVLVHFRESGDDKGRVRTRSTR